VNEQCGELRPHSRTLVDAFAIPQDGLACAILDEEDARQGRRWPRTSESAATPAARVRTGRPPGATSPRRRDGRVPQDTPVHPSRDGMIA
jgi:hypothetical protein